MNTHDEMDSLVHDALSEYRDAEPLAGLEERVLRRLDEDREKRRTPWSRWAVLAACAAVVAAALWIRPSNPPAQQKRVSQQEGAKTSEASPAAAATNAASIVKNLSEPQRRVPKPSGQLALAAANESHGTNPRLPEQFPAPVALTSDEQALVFTLNKSSKTRLAQSEADKPVDIAEIQIAPLSPASNEPGENQ